MPADVAFLDPARRLTISAIARSDRHVAIRHGDPIARNTGPSMMPAVFSHIRSAATGQVRVPVAITPTAGGLLIGFAARDSERHARVHEAEVGHGQRRQFRAAQCRRQPEQL
jgi:hypothetical protein